MLSLLTVDLIVADDGVVANVPIVLQGVDGAEMEVNEYIGLHACHNQCCHFRSC